MVDPMITDSPSDFTIDYGYTGVSISWTATDPNPNIYTIELQGSGMVVSPSLWVSGIEITYNVPDGLATGIYSYFVNFTDDYDNFITGTIIMTVKEVTPLTTFIITISLITGGIAVAGVAIVLLRKRKRKLEGV